MERVKTLIEKLQQQMNDGAPATIMLQTVQMLYTELVLIAGKGYQKIPGKVAVIIPERPMNPKSSGDGSLIPDREKIIEILQVDEKEVENELAEIKRRANSMHALSRPLEIDDNFDPLSDVPTLAHQNPNASTGKLFQPGIDYSGIPEYEGDLNDKLRETRTELSESLSSSPIKDLRKAVTVNDRFLFIKELFRNDEPMFERSIKTIQNFSIYPEAEFWIRRELKLKLGWDNNNPVVKQFDELVRRRFL